MSVKELMRNNIRKYKNLKLVNDILRDMIKYICMKC